MTPHVAPLVRVAESAAPFLPLDGISLGFCGPFAKPQRGEIFVDTITRPFKAKVAALYDFSLRSHAQAALLFAMAEYQFHLKQPPASEFADKLATVVAEASPGSQITHFSVTTNA